MKKVLLHILFGIVMTAFSVSCSYVMMNEGFDDDVNTHAVTLNLDLSTRAAAAADVAPGKPADLHVWVYSDDSAEPLHYVNYGSLNWIKTEGEVAPGQVEYYIAIRPIKLTGLRETARNLRVYALVNSGTVTWTANDFANLTENALKGQTFTGIMSSDDNNVPMFGLQSLAITGEKDYYHTSIDVERCVAKLELYFTRSNPNMDLVIHTVNLTKIPDNGFLAVPADFGSISSTGAEPLPVFSGIAPITAYLGRNEPQGNFSVVYDNDPEKFNYICWSYLMERSGMQWITASGNKDEIYDHEVASADAYVMTLQYTQGGVDKERDLFLSKIERNTRYRIFIRITEDLAVEINSRTIPWIEGEGEHIVDVSPGLPVDGVNPVQ